MDEEIKVDISRIRYRGTFDFQLLLNSIEGWLSDRKYKHSKSKFTHKESGGEAKVDIKIAGHRKVHEWAKVWVEATIEVRNFKDVEVVRHGQKQTLQQGVVMIELGGKINLDPYKRYKGAPWLEKIRDFINEYVLKQDIEGIFVDTHEHELLRLHRLIKEVLEFETPVSAKE